MRLSVCGVSGCGQETSLLVCSSCLTYAEKKLGRECGVQEARDLLNRTGTYAPRSGRQKFRGRKSGQVRDVQPWVRRELEENG